MSAFWLATIMLGAALFYLLVLRRFRSLGLRIFSITSFLTIGALVLLVGDWREQRSLQAHGETVAVQLLDKQRSGDDHLITIEWAGAPRTLSDYISTQEFERFIPGQRIELLHDRQSGKLFVKESFQRMVSQQWILHLAVGLLFLAGALAGWWLRQYRVGVDDEGNEWLEDAQGRISLDERHSPGARALKRMNLVSKLWQIFQR